MKILSCCEVEKNHLKSNSIRRTTFFFSRANVDESVHFSSLKFDSISKWTMNCEVKERKLVKSLRFLQRGLHAQTRYSHLCVCVWVILLMGLFPESAVGIRNFRESWPRPFVRSNVNHSPIQIYILHRYFQVRVHLYICRKSRKKRTWMTFVKRHLVDSGYETRLCTSDINSMSRCLCVCVRVHFAFTEVGSCDDNDYDQIDKPLI